MEYGTQLGAVVQLDALEDSLGDDAPEILSEVIVTFLDNLDVRLEELADAVERGDLRAMARIGHTLKGGAAMLGAGPIVLAARTLEQGAEVGRVDPDAYEALLVGASWVREALEVKRAEYARRLAGGVVVRLTAPA